MKNLGLVYFNVLGIDLTKLNLERFGENKGRDLNIYNRFFRTLVAGGAKFFFSEYKEIVIKNIYHDKGSQEEHEYFPWYTPYKLNLNDDKIRVIGDQIIFIDSDHRNYPDSNGVDFRRESQLVQFIDLILGSIHCCLHASATRREKIELGLIIKPLLRRLMEKPKNKNSSYHYYKKQQIQFFPKRKISEFSDKFTKQLDFNGNIVKLEKLYPDNFYTRRVIRLNDPKNCSVLDFFN